MSDMVIGRIEQLYKKSPHRFDHWLLDVDKEITGGDLIKSYTARIQELKEEIKEKDEKAGRLMHLKDKQAERLMTMQKGILELRKALEKKDVTFGEIQSTIEDTGCMRCNEAEDFAIEGIDKNIVTVLYRIATEALREGEGAKNISPNL